MVTLLFSRQKIVYLHATSLRAGKQSAEMIGAHFMHLHIVTVYRDYIVGYFIQFSTQAYHAVTSYLQS